MAQRIMIDVLARFESGRIRPLQVIWHDGRKYGIDKVLDVRRAASKSGGSGIRYTCLIAQRQVPLYFDEWENVWWCDSKD